MSDARQQRAQRVAVSRLGRAVYLAVRALIRAVLFRHFHLIARGREHLDVDGPLVLAPVHRSNLDAPLVAALSSRRVRSLAKDELFSPAPLGWFMAALGGFPVTRGAADRHALRAAQELLDAGEAILVFPEGTRQNGEQVAPVFDGAAFLAARSGARVVPIGVAGTEAAMPSGARFPRRTKVAIVAGEPLDPPAAGGERVTLRERRAYTSALGEELQRVFDEALIEVEQV